MKQKGYVFSIAPLPLLVRLLLSEKTAAIGQISASGAAVATGSAAGTATGAAASTLTGTASGTTASSIATGTATTATGAATGSSIAATGAATSTATMATGAAAGTAATVAATTAVGVAKTAAVAAAAKTGAGILATIGGKIAVGILGATVIGGATFGGVKAIPKIAENFASHSSIVVEETIPDSEVSDWEVETSESDYEDASLDSSWSENENSPEEIESESEEQKKDPDSSETAEKSDSSEKEEVSTAEEESEPENPEVVMLRNQIAVYQTYIEILTRNREALGYQFDTYGKSSLSVSDVYDTFSIFLYDVWGDETKELVFCVARMDSDKLVSDLYCISNDGSQIGYLTQDGFLLSDSEAIPLIEGFSNSLTYGGMTVGAFGSKKGIYISDIAGYSSDSDRSFRFITPENNSSDPYAKAEIVDLSYSGSDDTYLLDGEIITKNQYDQILSDAITTDSFRMISQVGSDYSFALNYEETIELLNQYIKDVEAYIRDAFYL